LDRGTPGLWPVVTNLGRFLVARRKEPSMEPKEKTRGYMLTSAGTLIIVLAVLLFGLTTDSGEIDWISVITAAAGFVMAGSGLYLMFRTRGPRTAS
jgi:hypothetical protein